MTIVEKIQAISRRKLEYESEKGYDPEGNFGGLDFNTADSVAEALSDAGLTPLQGEPVQGLPPLEEPDARTPASPARIALARRLYQKEDCNIDDGACVSDALPEGIWVQAWLWLDADSLRGIGEEIDK